MNRIARFVTPLPACLARRAGPVAARARALVAARAFCFLAALLAVPLAGAAGAPVIANMPAAPDANALREFVARNVEANGARVAIDLGEVDPRLRLAPCERIEPFVPSGARLYGRTHVGLRCKQAGGWAVYLPVHVHVYQRVPVAARMLAAGATVQADDVVLAERDVTLAGQGQAPSVEQIEGRVLARGYAAGQPLAMTAFRPNPVVVNGDRVKVLVQGDGFAITAAGVALARAEAGESIRVRLESGKLVQGIARAGKVVEMPL